MRPISSEGYYARALFPHMAPRNASRLLRRAGGAARLMACSLEARALMLGIPSENLKMLSLRTEEVPKFIPEIVQPLRNHKLHAKVRRRQA